MSKNKPSKNGAALERPADIDVRERLEQKAAEECSAPNKGDDERKAQRLPLERLDDVSYTFFLKSQEAMRQAQAQQALCFQVIAERYQLPEGSQIMPDGTILRAGG